jgi:hypothetical protein
MTATVIDQTMVTMEVVEEGLRLEYKSHRIRIYLYLTSQSFSFSHYCSRVSNLFSSLLSR